MGASDCLHPTLNAARAKASTLLVAVAAAAREAQHLSLVDLWGSALIANLCKAKRVPYVALLDGEHDWNDAKRHKALVDGHHEVVFQDPRLYPFEDGQVVIMSFCAYWAEYLDPYWFRRVVRRCRVFVLEHDIGPTAYRPFQYGEQLEAEAWVVTKRSLSGYPVPWLHMQVAGEPQPYHHPVPSWQRGVGGYIRRVEISSHDSTATVVASLVYSENLTPQPFFAEVPSALVTLVVRGSDALVVPRGGWFGSVLKMPVQLTHLFLVEALMSMRPLVEDARSPGAYRSVQAALAGLSVAKWGSVVLKTYTDTLLDYVGTIDLTRQNVGCTRFCNSLVASVTAAPMDAVTEMLGATFAASARLLALPMFHAPAYALGPPFERAVQPWVQRPASLDTLLLDLQESGKPSGKLSFTFPNEASRQEAIEWVRSGVVCPPRGGLNRLGPAVLVGLMTELRPYTFSGDPVTAFVGVAARFARRRPLRDERVNLFADAWLSRDTSRPVTVPAAAPFEVTMSLPRPFSDVFFSSMKPEEYILKYPARRCNLLKSRVEHAMPLGGVYEEAIRILEKSCSKSRNDVGVFVKQEAVENKVRDDAKDEKEYTKPRPILALDDNVLIAAGSAFAGALDFFHQLFPLTEEPGWNHRFKFKAGKTLVTFDIFPYFCPGRKASEISPLLNPTWAKQGKASDQSSCDSHNGMAPRAIRAVMSLAHPLSAIRTSGSPEERVFSALLKAAALPVCVSFRSKHMLGLILSLIMHSCLVTGTTITTSGNTCPLLAINILLALAAAHNYFLKSQLRRVHVRGNICVAGDDDAEVFSHPIFDGFDAAGWMRDYAAFDTKVIVFPTSSPGKMEFLGSRMFGGVLLPDPARVFGKLGWALQTQSTDPNWFVAKIYGQTGLTALPVLRVVREWACVEFDANHLHFNDDPEAQYKMQQYDGVMTPQILEDFCAFYECSPEEVMAAESRVREQLRSGAPLQSSVIDRIMAAGRAL